MYRIELISLFLLATLSLSSYSVQAASHCVSIMSDPERLACYDAAYGKVATSDSADELAKHSEIQKAPTALDIRMLEEAQVVSNPFAITPHKPNYILPITHNASSDYSNYGRLGEAFHPEEIKLQVSLKTPVLRQLWRDSSVWFAYTQQSYWQLYAEDFASAPFRETNYQPELFWQIPADIDVMGWRARLIRLGINHQSNGQTERRSRSWNRLIGEMVFDRGNFASSVRFWHRFKEPLEDDDNPAIADYMGRAQFGLSYKLGEQAYSVDVINNLRTRKNRSGIELNWTFPLVEHLKGYLQIYSGYGENMFDAQQYTNRIGIGFALNDWL